MFCPANADNETLLDVQLEFSSAMLKIWVDWVIWFPDHTGATGRNIGCNHYPHFISISKKPDHRPLRSMIKEN